MSLEIICTIYNFAFFHTLFDLMGGDETQKLVIGHLALQDVVSGGRRDVAISNAYLARVKI